MKEVSGARYSPFLSPYHPGERHQVPFSHFDTIFGAALARVIHSLWVRLWINGIQSVINCHQGSVAEYYVLQDT